MNFLARLRRCVGVIGLGAVLAGCSPSGQSRLDEQKDPNYLAGKRRVEALDYPGAAECFERALESNPRSAAAHYELGVIQYEKINDWAAAIYHFESYLRLEPQSHRVDTVKQLIAASKQELVKELPLTSLNQRELSHVGRLVTENNELRQQIEQLKLQLAQATLRSPVVTPTPALAESRTGGIAQIQPGSGSRSNPPAERATPLVPREATVSSPSVRMHTVRAGETPASIARSYNVALNSLMSANPGIEPRRMRPGQTVNIPAR